MSWVKLDDGMPENWKIEPLSDRAFRAHVTAMCYAARTMSDGFVPEGTAKAFAKRAPVLAELERDRWHPITGEVSRLWERIPGGFLVHDFLDYNPSRADVEAKRLADSKRKRGGVAKDSNRPGPYPSRSPKKGVTSMVSLP